MSTDPTPELNKALAAVQVRLPRITKGEEGKVTGTTKDGKSYSYTYKYADLSDISPIVLPLLGEEGLSWMCRPTVRDDHLALVYELRHSSGESVEGVYPLRNAGGPQDLGKEITYARRYALCAVTGIAPGDDEDDGASAQQAHRAQPAKPPTQPRKGPDPDAQRKKYHVMRGLLGWTEEMGHAFIEDLSSGRFTRWSELDERGRGVVLDAMQTELDEIEDTDRETGEVGT